ncbi:MAG: ribonuclease HIII [Melioribacteraceae bacterium]|nr:ribonuclease HIII [Melioribacteraceae bacterium]
MDIKNISYNRISSIKTELVECKISCTEIDEKQYNYEFTASSDRDKIKIQAYFGKKGVKVVLQGNRDSLLYTEINQIIFEQHQLDFMNKKNDEPKSYIGSDESGKGDVFGPLVTTAFYVDEKVKIKLTQLGVRDSKDLSEVQITKIAKMIRTEFPNNFETIPLYPEKYNELYNKFNNLNALLTWTHSKAISNLLNKFACNNVIVDKFSNRPINISSNSSDNNIDILQIPKAESYIGVAAASIIARDTFNWWFIKMKNNLFDFPKGASNNVEQTVKFFIKKYSFEEIKKVSKIHFKTVQKYI